MDELRKEKEEVLKRVEAGLGFDMLEYMHDDSLSEEEKRELHSKVVLAVYLEKRAIEGKTDIPDIYKFIEAKSHELKGENAHLKLAEIIFELPK